jgi:hypothetical protein
MGVRMAWNGQVPRVRSSRRDVLHGQRQLLPPQAVPSVEAIPGFSRARLPATYQAAQKAIAKCSRIDECKSWSDKAAALASYARQARDHTLRIMAERIQARAVRRCGELLKAVPSGQGSKNQHGELRDHAVTRQKAARDAGLSERQKVTALRVATLPAPDFEALIEAETPPTVTQLAQLGRHSRVVEREPVHHDSERAVKARKTFAILREFCGQNTPAELAKEFTSQDAQSLRACVAGLQRWLEEFAKNLPEGGTSVSAAAQAPH